MAVQTTEEFKNGGATSYTITIEYLQASDIKVRIGGTLQTYVASNPSSGEYTVSGTTVTLGAQAAAGTGNVHIYRETDVNTAAATFAAGSSIRAADLNAIHDMGRFAAVEHRNKIITANIKAGAVTSTEIADDTIVNADINANAAIDNSKIADGLLKSGITINSANIVNGSIVNDDVSNSANISGTKLADTSVPTNKLSAGALPTNVTVVSTNIVDGTIVNADINGSAAIAGTKIAPNFGSQVVQTTGNIVVGGTVDGRNVSTDGTKLDGIEAGATADQTNAEIKTAYEANANTNEFSDAEQTKLAGIETAATADQTAAEIKTLLQSDKLTNAQIETGTLDNRYYTETELSPTANAGQNVLDARYYTETEAEARFLRQDSSETIASGQTWSNSDAFVATTAAINARIVDLIDEVGGFTAIANETSFPTTNPQGATGQAAILSIAAASTTLTPTGTTLTIANGAGTGNTVTVTGVPTAIPQNFGFLVESTSTTHTYTFHRLVPIATQVNTVASNITNIVNAGANVVDINNFADIYQISSSAPTQRADGTSLQDGDLWFDNSNDNLRVYDGTNWSIITPAQSVLDDIAVVSGAITYSEDLGLITDAVATGSSNGSLDIVADALEDERSFTVTAATGKFIIDGVDKPALTLHKGWTYTFDVSDASNAAHPFRFQSSGSAYTTNVTVTGTQGQSGAKVQIVIPESQPTSFQYYCTAHSGMGNTITVVEDPIKAVADIAANVVTVAGISSNVTSVAGNNSNITAVANNATNINAVQANSSNINAAVSNASNINAAVSNATNINTVSGSISDVNRYAQEYKISSSAPTSPSAGDLWFDQSTNTLKNYNGSAWLGITSNSGIQNVADDTTPELAAALDCNNFNLTEVGTVSGNNLQIDFGTL